MLKKIYFCGVHSSGKTTLIDCLKPKLCFENATVLYCPEIARKVMRERGVTSVGGVRDLRQSQKPRLRVAGAIQNFFTGTGDQN